MEKVVVCVYLCNYATATYRITKQNGIAGATISQNDGIIIKEH
jgi:hypothetical protein